MNKYSHNLCVTDNGGTVSSSRSFFCSLYGMGIKDGYEIAIIDTFDRTVLRENAKIPAVRAFQTTPCSVRKTMVTRSKGKS